MAALGHQVAADLVEPGVGHDDADRRVGPERRRRRSARRTANGGGARDRSTGDAGRRPVVDRARGVDRHQRGHDEIGVDHRGRAEPSRAAVVAARATCRPSHRFPRRPARPRTVPSRRRGRGGSLVGPRADRAVALGQVVQGQTDDDGHDAAPGVANPTPSASSTRTTPSAAASPKADPPDSTTASSRATVRVGASSSNSRVAGAPPRTSPDAVVPSGNRTTVQPVRATRSLQWPTRTPSTSVITSRPSGGSGAGRGVRCRTPPRRRSCRPGRPTPGP